jgi:hypothetical protein
MVVVTSVARMETLARRRRSSEECTVTEGHMPTSPSRDEPACSNGDDGLPVDNGVSPGTKDGISAWVAQSRAKAGCQEEGMQQEASSLIEV